MKMNHIVMILVLLGTAVAVGDAGTNDLPTSLQRGLFEEEANHQLDAAIVDYKAAIENFDHERQLAATAIFRLGECYRKLGKTNEANVEYERIVREFSDQTQMAQLSQAYLPAGAGKLPSTAGEIGLPADEEKFLLEVKESVQNSPDLLYDKLFIAVEMGYVPAVEFLLTHGADAKRLSPALLCSAASKGNEAMVELLLKHGAPINAQNEHGITALLAAADSGYATVFHTLLDHGADVNLNTPIFAAVDHNNEAFVKSLLEHGAFADPVDDHGRTPLMKAAARNFDSICQLLLAHGANVNAADSDRDRPLNDALGSFRHDDKSLSLVQFLITKSADLEATNNMGQTPLLLVSAWVGEGPRRTVPPFQISLHPSAASSDSAKLLLDHGANPNVIDRDGNTPLWHAIQHGDVELVRLLIQHGANVNALDKNGQPPLAYVGSPPTEDLHRIRDLLLKAGADPEFSRRRGIWLADDAGQPSIQLLQTATNSINHYTLLEFLAVLYAVHDGKHDHPAGQYIREDFVHFPDLTRIIVHRLKGKESEVLRLNVAEWLRSGDCSKDIALQPGDVVEISKMEHKVADKWWGFPVDDITAMGRCLSRTVRIVASGRTNDVKLFPPIEEELAAKYHNGGGLDLPTGGGPNTPDFVLHFWDDTNVRSFHLDDVVRDKNILMNTWDLSRVRLIRGNEKMTFDLTTTIARRGQVPGALQSIPNPPDVWLENGDVIEIPDFGEVSVQANSASTGNGLH